MVDKMLEAKVAKPYAEALYQLGLNSYFKSSNSTEFYDMLFHIQEFVKLTEDNAILKDFLANPVVSGNKKKEVVRKCVNKDIDNKTLNFLYLLVDKKRISCLQSIYNEFLEKSNNFFSIKYVEVISAVEFTTDQEEILAKKLTTLFTPFYKEPPIVRLKFSIDESILGGFILKSNSKVTDLSVRGELKNLGKKLGVSI